MRMKAEGKSRSGSNSSPRLLPNGECGSDEGIPVSPSECDSLDAKTSNGDYSVVDGDVFLEKGSSQKVPKAVVPKELIIDKRKISKNGDSNNDKGFETFLMTGDMIIKTNPSLKVKHLEHGIERHHSDSSPYCEKVEKKTFKRSASSPDQSAFTGAKSLTHENATMDNLSKALQDELEDSLMNRKESAESGFEEQAVHSDTGTLEKREKLANDPTSVSDLSEVDSDDLLGNMVGSQTSTKCSNVSSVSTPSDLRSDISANTVLQQEVEPLINDDSSSSSSIDLSSSESFSEEMSHEMIFERSLSDSGGMSPVYQKDVKSLLASKSSEKIIIRKQLKQTLNEHQSVRASKSQENYVGDDLTFVSIDIDDTAYSLDQIPTCETPTKDEYKPFLVDLTHTKDYSITVKHDKPKNAKAAKTSEQTGRPSDIADERVFMPGFVKLSDSVQGSHDDDTGDDVDSIVVNDSDVTPAQESQGVGIDSADIDSGALDSRLETPDDNGDIDEDDEFDESINSGNRSDFHGSDNYYEEEPTFHTDDLFALPPVKSVDRPSAQRLAKRLFNLDGFRKMDVARHLCKKNDFNILVAEEYLKFFDFAEDSLDAALRKFLGQFSLIGETQERERVLAHFSRHYIESNPGTYNSEDACHTLVCALMLLNTDLHGQAVGRKMACSEFIENLADLNDGANFPKEVLKSLYNAIKAQPIEWAPDEEFQDTDQTGGGSDSKSLTQSGPTPSLPHLPPVVGRNPFLDVPDPEHTTEYKRGYIMRKCCVDPDGRKTAVGKRGWKMFFVVLRDMILYLYKDEQALKKSPTLGSHNAIRIHHCLASKASDYSKKQHVFRLQTADWAEYLFQTSNTKECQEWIDTLNFVAASLSAPPLPGACGSQKKFQRPLLPASYTRLNMQGQLAGLQERLNLVELDLQEHRQFPPEKGSKASAIHYFVEKETYLSSEIARLKTYIYLLQSKLASHTELEPSLVETTIGEDEEGIKGVNSNSHVGVTSPAQTKAPVQRSLSDRGGPLGSPENLGSNLENPTENSGSNLENSTENLGSGLTSKPASCLGSSTETSPGSSPKFNHFGELLHKQSENTYL
ncbi:uncharacterized protein LOC128225212 isoform X2 [Mya arenaria]|uniref:uncharacterized protein LOC128225212 isoform X2 n=1 Tax=Mya arenaria TaxID=6604 RepID=UPI0022E33A3E|nr:uncharacterized protein LOC128225212 isoform X2 [Mya arenaria]XP_052791253.1 uncharacterized protein LOC128225212 isoform X2 [Mya arenaria]XP_052791254.1 uncharacterized protein LOC128225212 isoform X2 [Mya arenaria]XP_052791255.1 uncharacterized protein LOC128225212 isoform X2 [Mya arenaria]XP_052791256.1 uncharacterized protein LOC128225212 isoform X2 [Mya arenaria]XP_052791257.1 uncharacterized protein LOC128225212 isoform X2 [Mya arenaria]